jgi:hypothetical protein
MIIVAVVCRVCRVCVVCRLRGECRRSLSVLLQFYLRGECRRSLSVLLQFHLRGECRRSLSVLLHLRRRPLGRLLRKCRSDAVDDDLTLREYRRVQEMGALGLSLVFLCGLRSLVHIYVLPIDQPSCHAWHSRSARVPTLKRSWEHTVYGIPYYSCVTRLLFGM